MRSKVELHPAWSWDCEACGAENFVRCVSAEFVDDEDRESAYRHFHYLEDHEPLPDNWREFDLVTYPDVLRCSECSSEFEVQEALPDED